VTLPTRRVATIAMTLFLLAAPRSVHSNEIPSGSRSYDSPVVFSATPTYRWDSVAGATSYFLWVGDDETPTVSGWYSATQLGCSSGDVCAVTPAQTLTAGQWRWSVRARSATEYGPWSAPASFTASTPTVPAQVAPSGTVTTRTLTYRWNSPLGAAWYEVWVSSAGSVVLHQWYPASSLGCPSANQTCTLATTGVVANGTKTWWVRGWNSLGYGPWSSGMTFTLSQS
jgi:hypothetical protein